MDKQLVPMQEANTGLTMAMEGYKFAVRGRPLAAVMIHV
jgi:hypothetical protein